MLRAAQTPGERDLAELAAVARLFLKDFLHIVPAQRHDPAQQLTNPGMAHRISPRPIVERTMELRCRPKSADFVFYACPIMWQARKAEPLWCTFRKDANRQLQHPRRWRGPCRSAGGSDRGAAAGRRGTCRSDRFDGDRAHRPPAEV